MKRPPVERYARAIPSEKAESVRLATAKVADARRNALAAFFGNAEAARAQAAQIKADVLDRLPELLNQLEIACRSNSITVHRASDGVEANQIIADICRNSMSPGEVIVKAKSMATEEIHLNDHLDSIGYKVVETDLGEYVVQIDTDHPSHIVAPIIHKSRTDVAQSFAREGLGPYTESPEELAMQARAKLRDSFQQAKVGISGVNFAIASSGRIVIVENEGNNRLSTTAPEVHIALMGIEKLLPTEESLPLFLKLLASSATGQQITSYVHLISGPRRVDEVDGPREVHLVLLDNGRSKVLAGPYRDVLRCIRCGACLNICPVYRQASGHAYGHVYPGPIGAVLAPALEGVESFGHLAKASSLCGACEEVCPVKIPIPSLLLKLRDEQTEKGISDTKIPWGTYATGATHPSFWRAGLKLLPVASMVPHPLKSAWTEFRALPQRHGRSFRDWWQVNHTATQASAVHVDNSNSSMEGQESNAPQEQTDAWGRFEARLIALGGRMAKLEDVVFADKVCYIDTDVTLPGLETTQNVWQADIGITRAEFAIAETGSVVLSSGTDHARLASLTPPVHVVLVDRIVNTLEEGIAQLSNRTSVIVSGTSRTADIEGVLVRGVHGPGDVIVVRSDGGDGATNA